jgi:hypothetical protein
MDLKYVVVSNTATTAHGQFTKLNPHDIKAHEECMRRQHRGKTDLPEAMAETRMQHA